jgi:glycosyltransferase involved in cell wall biosynthesis
MFLATSLPVGGAETLLLNLVRRIDRDRVAPEVCCLKEPGELGPALAATSPLFHGLIRHKYDAWVIARLARLFRRRRIDAVVTVGAGDKMFWGRIAAHLAATPVVLSALHSTGWPDSIGWLNRRLTPWTDGFIAVAQGHARHLTEVEGLPPAKVHLIRNGVDVERFRPLDPAAARAALGLEPAAPVAGILAALRPEKNHELFLEAARQVSGDLPQARFLVIGDGPERARLERLAAELGLAQAVRFLGNRPDVPEVLAALDVVVLCSHVEASPVSVLEALACERPVVATNVGSVAESVHPGRSGYLVPPGDAAGLASHLRRLLRHPEERWALGQAGRNWVVRQASVEQMVQGYEELIGRAYRTKCRPAAAGRAPADAERLAPLVEGSD